MKKLISIVTKRLTIRNLLLAAIYIIDRFRGLDFITVIQPEEAGLDSSIAQRSSPSGNRYLSALLKDMKITNNDAIIDIGCGKGSAMRIMLKFPFAQVAGVELSVPIGDIAIRNFKKLNAKRSIVHICDASTFQHYALYNFFYFYNPFPSQIMSKVISNISQSTKESGKEILIIYDNPVCHDIVIGQGGYYQVKEYPDEWGNQIYVYSNRCPECSRLSR